MRVVSSIPAGSTDYRRVKFMSKNRIKPSLRAHDSTSSTRYRVSLLLETLDRLAGGVGLTDESSTAVTARATQHPLSLLFSALLCSSPILPSLVDDGGKPQQHPEVHVEGGQLAFVQPPVAFPQDGHRQPLVVPDEMLLTTRRAARHSPFTIVVGNIGSGEGEGNKTRGHKKAEKMKNVPGKETNAAALVSS